MRRNGWRDKIFSKRINFNLIFLHLIPEFPRFQITVFFRITYEIHPKYEGKIALY